MMNGTKGATLAARAEEPATMLRDMVEEGIMPKLTAEELDEIGEKEFSRRTDGGWGRWTCPACHIAPSANGCCDCSDDPIGELERATMVLRSCGLI